MYSVDLIAVSTTQYPQQQLPHYEAQSSAQHSTEHFVWHSVQEISQYLGTGVALNGERIREQARKRWPQIKHLEEKKEKPEALEGSCPLKL